MSFEPIFRLSLLISLALLGFVALLIVALIISKGLRQLWLRYSSWREDRFRRLVLGAIATDHPQAAGRLLSCLSWPGDRRVVKAYLLRLAEGLSGHGRERIYALFESAGFADDEIGRLGSWRWWVRAQAAQRLGIMMCSKAAPELVLALDDRSIEVRLMAAWALGRFGDWPALFRIVEALARYSKLATLRVTEIIMQIGAAAGPMVELLLKHADEDVRLLAVRLAGLIKDEKAAGQLREFVKDPSVDIRVASCEALGALGGARGASSLVEALSDAAWPVRAKAALMLGRLALPQTAEALRTTLSDPAWWVRLNSGRALSRMGQAGREILQSALSHPDRFARDMAAQWLDESEPALGTR
ncbi:MAG: HEAT repeat domain-containing protein [Elusimicrobia bacterium]|nr:HEAT repeat domain-containing protein [Elusimicrobiota bacterium]